MFTLTGQDRHGVFLCHELDSLGKPILRVRNCTKKGFEEAGIGDGVALGFPESSTRRGRVKKQCAQTLDCACQIGTVMKCGRIRRLTPRECFRLQGFPDELYEKAAAVNSETQLYKQAGNAVTATVAYAVAMALPESRELLAQMGAVWEEAGGSVTERAYSGESAQEDFGDMENQDTIMEDTGNFGAESDEEFDFLD